MTRKAKLIPLTIAVTCSLLMLTGVCLAASDESTPDLSQEDKENIQKQVDAAMAQVDKTLEEVLPEVQVQVDAAMKQVEDVLENVLPQALDEALADLPMDITVPHMPHMPHIAQLPHMQHKGHIVDSFHGEIESTTIEETFAVAPGTPLHAECTFSSVRVEPSDRDSEISIVVGKYAGADDQELAEQMLQSIQVSLEQTDEAVKLNITIDNNKEDKKKQRNNMFHCIVAIRIPSGTPLHLRNSFGDTLVSGISGDIECGSSFGLAQIDGTRGTLNARNKYGDLHISGHDGNGVVHGEFGNVTIVGWTGELEVGTSYGKTRITSDARDTRIRGKFSFGDAHIELPADFSGKIEAAASFGHIRAPEALAKKKGMFDESVEGSIGEGDGYVRVQNSYAPVTITLAEEG